MKSLTHNLKFRTLKADLKKKKLTMGDLVASNMKLLDYIQQLDDRIIELEKRVSELEPDVVTKRNELIEKIKKLRKEGWSLGAIGLKLGMDDSVIRPLWAEIKKEEEPDVGVGIEPKDE